MHVHLQTGRLCKLQAQLDTAKLKIMTTYGSVLTECISAKTPFRGDEWHSGLSQILFAPKIKKKMLSTLINLKRLDKKSKTIRAYQKCQSDAFLKETCVQYDTGSQPNS